MSISIAKRARNSNLMGHFESSCLDNTGRRYRRGGINADPDTGLGYHDESCKDADKLYGYRGKCVDCPLPICLEGQKSRQKADMTMKVNRAQRLSQQGESVQAIAIMLGVSERTVQRRLAVAKLGDNYV